MPSRDKALPCLLNIGGIFIFQQSRGANKDKAMPCLYRITG
ncbi:hypothetical protein QEG73_02680 [Chitinophagaceae bacterium 26-R-25]|nr:hypothetical protein [Chitinophagaceae bacterium 26-R-25]